MTRRLLLPLVVIGLAACGRDAASSVSVPAAEPTVTSSPVDGDGVDGDPVGPPDVVLSRGELELALAPTTFCWTPIDEDVGLCADGVDPDPLPELPGDGPLVVEFGEPGFRFTASAGDSALEATTVDGVTTFEAPTSTPTVVRIVGVGEQGDVYVAVRLV